MTGTVRQVANRVIAELAHLGLLEVERGHIRILDRARLAAQLGEEQPE